MTSTDPRWTAEQITAHATWLRATHGDNLESLTINETAGDHGIDVEGWGPDEWEAYGDAVEGILDAAPDLTDWSIALGADGLEPSDQQLTLGHGEPRLRIHFSFAPDMSEADRRDFVAQIAEATITAS